MSQAIRSPAFWLLLVAALGAIGPIRMLTVHQIAIITDAGFERTFTASVVGLSGAITAMAFIILGAISDKVDRRIIYALGSLSMILAMFILNALQSPEHSVFVFAYAIFMGLGEGSRSSLVTAVASDLFPGNALGAINGAVGAFFGMGAAIIPWLAGLIFDLQGDYSLSFLIAALAVVISTLSLWIAPNFLHRHSKVFL
jgi:MFS family permease